jgi:flagellar biosynthesis protein FlhB
MAEEEEKTERGTQRKREQAREKGQLVRSKDLVSASVMTGILFTLYMTGRTFMRHMSGMMSDLLGLRYGRDPFKALHLAAAETIWILVPFFGVAVLAAVASSLAQGGFLFKPLSLQFEKVNPVSGMKRLASKEGLMETGKSLFKFTLIGFVLYAVIRNVLAVLPQTLLMDLGDVLSVTVKVIARSALYGLLAFFGIAAADYFVQRWRFERSLRMTKDEIRQEFKETEGDPLIRSRIKTLQRDMARKRMMQEVPKATVVITNPTHLAVALKYEQGGKAAPKVVAKGADVIAANIRELARQHNVPLVEDKPLARALFKLKLDSVIPEELYRAVAKILAHVYTLKGSAPRPGKGA